MQTRRPVRPRTASTLLALSAALLATAAAPMSAGAAVGDVTSIPTRADTDGNVGITAGSDGNLWFVDAGNMTEEDPRDPKIWRVTPSGALTGFAVAPKTNTGDLRTITSGADGNLWYQDLVGGITRMSTDGTQRTSFPTPLTAAPTSSSLQTLAPSPNGDIWWGSVSERLVGRVTASGVVSEYNGETGVPLGLGPIATAGPSFFGATPAADGTMWFSGSFSGQLLRVTSQAPFALSATGIDVVDAVDALPTGPTKLALGADGNIWFNHLLGKVGKVTPAGVITSYPKRPGSTSGFSIAAGPDGNMWYVVSPVDADDTHTYRPGQIGRVTPTGETQEWPLPDAADIVDLTAGPDGRMWATDGGYSALLKIDTGASAAVTGIPSLTGAGTVGSTLTCGGEAFAAWPGGAPSKTVSWLSDGAVIAGATQRTYVTTAADVGHAIRCRVTAKYAVQRVWAPATSEAVTISVTTPTPTPTPAPTPTPVPTPAPTPTPAPAPGPTPTPSVPNNGTTKPPVVTPPVAQSQVITCKYKKAKGKKAAKATCKTTLSPPVAASSRAVAGTINRSGKAYKATVIVGSAALRIVSPKVLPAGKYVLKVGKKSWTIAIA